MIQPPWTAYQLVVGPTTMNSPPVPAVAIIERGLDGDWLRQHTLDVAQAERLAFLLVEASGVAGEPGSHPLGSAV